MTEVETASTSTSSEKDRMEATAEASKILSQGKRNLVCGEVPTAVNQFQEACKLLAKAYGETAKECAEAYFCYGQSLLDLARMETGVLGNALQGVPEEEEEATKSADEQFENGDKLDVEEREKLRMEVYDAMSEKEKEEKEKENKEKETDEKGDAKKEEKTENGDAEKDKTTEKGDEKMDDETEKAEEKKDEVIKEKGDENKDEKGEKKDDSKKEEETVNGKDEEKMETDESANVKKDEATNGKEEDKGEGKAEDGEKEGKEEDGEKEGKEDDTEEGDDAEEGDTAEEGETGEEGEDTAEEVDGKKENEEDADDVSNLQLAWEMLELSKVIYLKEDNKESKLKAADSYLKLGEVSLETEQYEQSIADFNECLTIQKTHLEPEDRSLAETYYQLGLAYCFNKQYDESIDSYRAAIKVLEDRIAKLSKVVEGGTEKKDDEKEKKDEEKEKKDAENKEKETTEDPVKAAETEIEEIKELLPDMRQKIEDSEEEKKNYEQLKKMAKEAVGFGSESKEPEESNTDSKPASNISHLIRRKRKPDEDEPTEQDNKKTKQDDDAGDAVVNGAKENGVMEVDKKKTGEELPPAEAVAS